MGDDDDERQTVWLRPSIHLHVCSSGDGATMVEPVAAGSARPTHDRGFAAGLRQLLPRTPGRRDAGQGQADLSLRGRGGSTAPRHKSTDEVSTLGMAGGAALLSERTA